MRALQVGLWLALVLGCLSPVEVMAQSAEVESTESSRADYSPRQLPARSAERSGKKSLTPPNGGTAGRTSGPSGWWTTAAGLMVVLGLIMGCMRLFKKHLPGATRFLPTQAVQVLGKRPLDYKQNIYLLRCGSKILVVGASPQGMTTLGEITEPVEVDYLAGLCQAQDQQSVGETFSQIFRQFRPEGTPSSSQSVETGDSEFAAAPEKSSRRVRESRFANSADSLLDLNRTEEQHV